MKIIKNIIFKIIYVFIIIYLLIFVPMLWGQKPLVVVSGSMEPTLKVGGLLYYEEQDIKDFKIDDVLVFKTKSHIVSHRIVDITETGFITKGDANESIDLNEIKNEQVIGKGTNWSISYLGFYADYIYTHKYILFIWIFIIIMDITWDTYKKKVGTENDEKD